VLLTGSVPAKLMRVSARRRPDGDGMEKRGLVRAGFNRDLSVPPRMPNPAPAETIAA